MEEPFNHCDADNVCVHKDLFPQEPIEVVGTFVFSIVMALCTVAGIGGGGPATYTVKAFFKFDMKSAIAISSFSILACSTMRFFYNFNTKNPKQKNMAVIDYGLASIMMPTTIAGSFIGGYFLLVFPAIYIHIALVVLFIFLTILTFGKATKMAKLEEDAAQQLIQEENSAIADDPDKKPLLPASQDENEDVTVETADDPTMKPLLPSSLDVALENP